MSERDDWLHFEIARASPFIHLPADKAPRFKSNAKARETEVRKILVAGLLSLGIGFTASAPSQAMMAGAPISVTNNVISIDYDIYRAARGRCSPRLVRVLRAWLRLARSPSLLPSDGLSPRHAMARLSSGRDLCAGWPQSLLQGIPVPSPWKCRVLLLIRGRGKTYKRGERVRYCRNRGGWHGLAVIATFALLAATQMAQSADRRILTPLDRQCLAICQERADYCYQHLRTEREKEGCKGWGSNCKRACF